MCVSSEQCSRHVSICRNQTIKRQGNANFIFMRICCFGILNKLNEFIHCWNGSCEPHRYENGMNLLNRTALNGTLACWLLFFLPLLSILLWFHRWWWISEAKIVFAMSQFIVGTFISWNYYILCLLCIIMRA